jgi:hypothetical protein
VNAFNVPENIKQSVSLVNIYCLLISVHSLKHYSLPSYMRNVLLCVKCVLPSNLKDVRYQTVNSKVLAQTFALNVPVARLDRYSKTSIRFLTPPTTHSHLFSNIYILTKQSN